MKTSDVLRAGLAKFGPNGENWRKAPEVFPREGKHCTHSAISRLAGDITPAVRYVLKVTNTNSPSALWDWNDSEGRTFDEVRDVYAKAISLAEADEKSTEVQA
jgi:hypothetical protein